MTLPDQGTRAYEPPDLGWDCVPCGERHQFGDICWYWDVDPDDPRSVISHAFDERRGG